MKVSIIIPTYNEERYLEKLLPYLQQNSTPLLLEIIVVDCGSSDNTVSVALEHNARVISTNIKGRAHQLNVGAQNSDGEILYFVHADTIPPSGFDRLIVDTLDFDTNAGCFTSIFDWDHPFLRFCNFFSRLPFWFCRGGGQTLFVTKKLFMSINGFDEHMKIMEEYEFIGRVKTNTRFSIVKKNAITSARDYRNNGPFRLQFIYACVFILYAVGASQNYMIDFINRHISNSTKSCS